MSEATDALSRRRVIVKKASELQARQALGREVDLITQLGTPGLPAILTAASFEEADIAVFEHIELPDLTTHLASHPEEATRVAGELLRLLEAMHAAGLVHGDLKPEHVLVGPEGIRLIDLGLAVRLGTMVRGGTHGYIAPEYLTGSTASVAGELYAFGKTLLNASRSQLDEPLLGIVRACTESRPEDRPASAGAVAAALGVSTASLESREGPFGSREALEVCRNLALEGQGGSAVVRGAKGAGRSRLVDELLRTCVRKRLPVCALQVEQEEDPLVRLGSVLGVEAADVSAIGERLAQLHIRLIVDDADAAKTDAWIRLGESFREHGQGACILVGSSEELADGLVALGAVQAFLEPLSNDQIAALFRAHGVRSDPVLVSALSKATSGRAGWIVRASRLLARSPGLTTSDLADIVAGFEPGPTSLVEAWELPEVLRRSQQALDSGAPRRAVQLLRSALPRFPQETKKLLAMLGRAEARAGRLEEAARVFDSMGQGAPMEARVDHAHVLERLGRHERARALALDILSDCDVASIAARAARIAAASTLSLGDPVEADALAARGLERGGSAATTVRLVSIRSDAALRRGDAASALSYGKDALKRAQLLEDGSLMAQAHARMGAARSLMGDVEQAKRAFADALEHAEASCDPVDLPPYVMNLATAEHRLGELGRAIEGYERAAQLSNRLGRAGSEAAARTNLGGLLAFVGARQEAERVLSEALQIAECADLAVYRAHIAMTRAEMAIADAPHKARVLACEAASAFRASGNWSGFYESRLIEAEAALVQHDPSVAERLLDAEREPLERAGLACRTAALQAKVALARGDGEAARVHAEAYLNASREQAECDDQARALHMLGVIHESLGTGAQDGYFVEARQSLGKLAARLPPGLRERFLADPRRTEISALARVERTPSQREGLDMRAKRVLGLVARIVLEPDEVRVLEAAVDEAVSLTSAERAFLLMRKSEGQPRVEVARNLDRETIRNSRFRFSRSVAQQVLDTGEPVMTASASEDPSLRGARSVLDLGLRSILCVPIRGPRGVCAALYLDHRFQAGHFQSGDLEVVQSLADVIGVALENTRLHREASERARELEQAHDALRSESIRKDAELERLQNALLRGERTASDTGGIVGDSEPLRQAIGVARRVAPSNLPVLIEGESGTGKELFARFLHDRSRRAKGPFVPLNCGAIPDSLVESELFGHVRGAFTGALQDHPGLFRAASGGTLMLDEIGEMPLRVQARLLRVLQEREVRPVGGERSIRVDVRVIAATNRDLAAETKAGRFRSDLYYRIAGVTVRLPPLRDRRDDILPLSQVLLARISEEQCSPQLPLGRRALSALLGHDWPGNVRELEHCLRRALAVAQGEEIEVWDLGLDGSRPRAAPSARRLDEWAVQDALHKTGGNRTRAAQLLGVSRITLHRFLAKHGSPVPARAGRPPARVKR